jgi:hypothetical protein
MNSPLSDQNFYKVKDLEIELRGRHMRFAVKVEGLIMRNIFFLNEEKFLKTNVEDPINLKDLMFHKKIEKLQSLLKESHADLEVKYADLFLELCKFKEIRNKMAHNYFTWDENDLTKLTIWEIEKDGRIQFFAAKEYDLKTIDNELNKFIIFLVEKLNSLSCEIEHWLKPIMPYMFAGTK